jgi:hypothetical protein
MSGDSNERGPIFIGGVDRSGKTYMRLVLASHPHIAMSRRTNLWPKTYQRYGDLSRPDNLQRCLQALLDNKHVASLNPDADRILAEFRQGEPTYARLYDLIQQHYAEGEGKLRWGDQSELIERFAVPVLESYPTAKFVHMIRDPRDRYAAGLARRSRKIRRGSVGGATARWLYSARLALSNREKYPERYKVVRYETLVTQPEATVRQVCDFLGEDFFPAMLSMDSTGRFDRDEGLKPGGSPLSAEFVGEFAGRLSKLEVAFIQARAGREMVSFGYSLAPLSLSIGEQLLFYGFEWPLNLGRMVAWRSAKSARFRRDARPLIALRTR